MTQEIKHREQERQCLLEREQQMRLAQSDFIDLISHEYRTPLAALQAHLQVLKLKPRLTEQQANLEAIDQASNRLAEIFDKRLSDHNLLLKPANARESVDLVGLTRELLALYSGSACALHWTLHSPQTALVVGDRSLLRTILINLIDNASKYAEINSNVEIEITSEDAYREYSISNQTALEPPRDSQRLLQKHTRGANAEEIVGRGMGLYLAERLARDLGGQLQVLSDERRFKVKLRLQAAEMGPPDAMETAP